MKKIPEMFDLIIKLMETALTAAVLSLWAIICSALGLDIGLYIGYLNFGAEP